MYHNSPCKPAVSYMQSVWNLLCQSGPWISFSFCTLVCRAKNAEYSFRDDQPLQYFRLCSQPGLCVRELELEGSLVSVTKLTLLVLYMHFRYVTCSCVSFLVYLMSTFMLRCVTYGKIPQPDINLLPPPSGP